VTPRGVRLNNPGNIRRDGTLWLGFADDQSDAEFVTFTAPAYGIRAIARIMKSYQRKGVTTLEEAINRWAPPVENNTSAYVSAVCKDCNIAPDKVVDFNAIMPTLVKAIIRHENGEQPYSDDLINYGISLA
jgi:hypothetical protein